MSDLGRRPQISLDALMEESRRESRLRNEPTVGEVLDAILDLRDRYRRDPDATRVEMIEMGWSEDDIVKFVKMAVYG